VNGCLEKIQLEWCNFCKNRFEFHRTLSSNSIISLNSSSFAEFFIWLERGGVEEENRIGFSSNG
jgi:hypothetical protein